MVLNAYYFHNNVRKKMSKCNVCERKKPEKRCLKCMIKTHNDLEKYIKSNFKNRQEFLNKIDAFQRHEYLKYILEIQEKHGPCTRRFKWYYPILDCL